MIKATRRLPESDAHSPPVSTPPIFTNTLLPCLRNEYLYIYQTRVTISSRGLANNLPPEKGQYYHFCHLITFLSSVYLFSQRPAKELPSFPFPRAMEHKMFLFLSLLLTAFSSARSDSFIGVNYGQVADNLPPATATARLLQSTPISKVRLYGADPVIIRAFAGTNISIVIGASNGEIPALAADPAAAANWAAANVLPFVPASKISLVSVGNEVLTSNDPNLAAALLPAMQNLNTALSAAGVSAKVSTVHSMAVLAQSDPPSTGSFHSDLAPNLKSILGFLQKTGSPFMINPYPYFAYRSDPRPDTLAFCLFQPNAGRRDGNTGIVYQTMFDAQLNAVRSAVGAAGFPAAEIVVAETGWPYKGDDGEVGATVDNAKAFTVNLVAHLRSMAKPVDTYIFALYDEDLKPGPTSERSFGLFRPDLTPTYDAGLTAAAAPGSAAAPERKKTAGWCVPREGATEVELQADLDYACAQQEVDCRPIQPGGACYLPNTVRSHAAYAMNQLYQVSGRQAWNCDFRQSATLTAENPSYDSCAYPGS